MRRLKKFIVLAVILAVPCVSGAANLTSQGISILDGNGNSRPAFSNTESVILRQQVTNSALSAGMIGFEFYIINPAGAVVFTHTGNAAPGTPGTAQSQLSGIFIASFYSVPGSYVFRGVAKLDAEIVTQQVAFMISSPNINLIYPPYGAKGLSDKPLTFRWVASGASRYRLTVSDNAGLYNPVHQAVNNGEGAYSYPENPTQPRERLVPEQVYYWRIEGLDAAGSKISESNISNFSLKSQASSQTRNVAVVALVMTTPENDFKKPLNFKATLFNTGSTNETNIAAKLTLGGLPAQDSPKQVQFLNAGEKNDIPFTAFVPEGQDTALAVACIDLFDDNIPDNCKTMLITKNAGSPGGPSGDTKKLTYDEMYDAILKKLGPDALTALDGYTFDSITCANCAPGELDSLVLGLLNGDSGVANASITESALAPQSASVSGTAPAASSPGGTFAEEPQEIQLELPEAQKESATEWSGFTEALTSDEARTYAVKTKKDWKKIWKLLSGDEVPAIDFDSKTVIGLVAGKKDRAETVRLLGKRRSGEGVAFDYYVIEAPKDRESPFSAYTFKVVDKVDEKVEFTRLDVSKQQ